MVGEMIGARFWAENNSCKKLFLSQVGKSDKLALNKFIEYCTDLPPGT